MTQESQKLSVLEKVGYSLGDLAANLVFQTLVTYLAYFYTDIYGLKTEDATLVTLFVGLFAAFVFNPVMGAIADRTSTRWGKFRPWILWTAVPLGVTALLAFSTPNFEYQGKVIYAVITYSLLLLLYAANNLPYSALSGVITGDMAERNSMSAYRFVAVMFSQFFVQVFMYNLILKAGDGDKAVGIEKVMTILAIVGTLMLLVTFFTTKERIVPKPEQKSSLKEDLGDLFKNIPWIIMLVTTTLVFVTLAMKGGSYVYYFENYVDKAQLTTFLEPMKSFLPAFENDISMGLGVFNGGGILIGLIGIMLSKKFADKYGKRNVFGASLFVSTLFIIFFYFFPPQSVGLMFGSQILHMFFYGISTPILWTMIADVADYSEWKNNRRATAIIFSAMMVGLKGGLSIGSSLLTMILGLFNYQANLEVAQSAETINGIKLLVSIFPAIPFLIACGLLFFYEINKKMELKIESDLKERR
ncbi:MFS transporter [Lacihabitans sp. CS3-21]|jgi:glycoside/pentoside/hexuronide:cation symporter, GPH family|uniref:MFS transporter n=1 Tax=Lacihabitans sp. CS3-21 TaxID=2487332 RepID=UPI000BD32018|nr:MFS transporter [Lacihabitans sp. CS3-21]MCP9747063.1 MFS transporter [Lacihabitans sp. CS3-21]MDP1815527.1 MFS transporter [Leadbetterella sp.]OYU93664.1 MAG: MFS transporter [Bacteroidetes bacterium B1(2017)]